MSCHAYAYEYLYLLSTPTHPLPHSLPRWSVSAFYIATPLSCINQKVLSVLLNNGPSYVTLLLWRNCGHLHSGLWALCLALPHDRVVHTHPSQRNVGTLVNWWLKKRKGKKKNLCNSVHVCLCQWDWRGEKMIRPTILNRPIACLFPMGETC